MTELVRNADDLPLPEPFAWRIQKHLADAIRAAAATERAAKVCDEHASIEGIAQACAAAIRQSQT